MKQRGRGEHLYVGRASSLTHLSKQGETVQDEAAWVRPGGESMLLAPRGWPGGSISTTWGLQMQILRVHPQSQHLLS